MGRALKTSTIDMVYVGINESSDSIFCYDLSGSGAQSTIINYFVNVLRTRYPTKNFGSDCESRGVLYFYLYQ